MSEGYYRAEGDDAYPWLDEFLCEYADGTMDPSVRKAFDEYLLANPYLAEHAEQLRCTHLLLCHHGCRLRAPEGLEARVRQRLSGEMMQSQRGPFAAATASLGRLTLLTSVAALMLVAGMLAGPVLIPSATHAGPAQVGPRYEQPSPYRTVRVPIRPTEHAHYHSASRFGTTSVVRSLAQQQVLVRRPFQAPDTLIQVAVSE